MHGNVAEWCLDAFATYDRPCAPGNGHRSGGGIRIARGGSFDEVALFARASHRKTLLASTQLGVVGLRPARTVLP